MDGKLNGIILDGKVYITDPAAASCADCDLCEMCCGMLEEEEWCIRAGATKDNDFGFRYSQELTDKINDKY